MLTLLLLMERCVTGGSERRFLRLAQHLPRDRFDIRIGVLQPGGDLADAFAATGLPITPFYRRWRFDLAPVTQIARYCRAEHIAVMHAMHWLSGTFAALAARQAPQTAAIGSTVGRIYDSNRLGFARAMADRALQSNLAAMVVNSATLRDYLIQHHYPAGKITVIPNGVVAPDLAPRPERRAAIRAQYGIPADAPCVGILARLEPVKDHATLLHAWRLAHERMPDAQLMIAGDGAERARLESLAASLDLGGSVIFAGNVAGADAVMPAWDVAALCSRHEGLPNAILEAMAWSLPVVGARVGGIPDLVQDGVTGCLVPPGDPPALADAVLGLLTQPERAQTMGVAGRARMLAEWSVDHMVDRFTDLYMMVAEQRHQRKG